MFCLVSTLGDIRNAITSSEGESKLLLCVRFFYFYGKKKTKDVSSSDRTFMTKTIRPLVLCFQNHFKSNSTLFLKKIDVDGSIYNFGTKFCKGKKGQSCTCSIIQRNILIIIIQLLSVHFYVVMVFPMCFVGVSNS